MGAFSQAAARQLLGPEVKLQPFPRFEDVFRSLKTGIVEGALPLSVPLTVDIKVGDDWEQMTPLTREDAIAAEAGELPLEAPLAPIG